MIREREGEEEGEEEGEGDGERERRNIPDDSDRCC